MASNRNSRKAAVMTKHAQLTTVIQDAIQYDWDRVSVKESLELVMKIVKRHCTCKECKEARGDKR